MSQLAKVKRSEQDCVVLNQRNTFAYRLRDNMRRDTIHGASKPVLARRHPRVTGNSPLEMKISDIQAKQREGQSRIKELREKTEALDSRWCEEECQLQGLKVQ